MSRLVKLAAIAGASALVLSGCAGAANEETTGAESSLSGTISGSGASSMGSGQEAWIAEFQTL